MERAYLGAAPSAVGYSSGYPKVMAASGAFTLLAAQCGYVVEATGTFSIATDAAANLFNGFSFYLRNVGSGVVTIAPASGQLVNGAASQAVLSKQECLVVFDGANWRTVGLHQRVLLDSAALSGAANRVFALAAGYSSFELRWQDVVASVSNAYLAATLSVDGGTNYLASYTVSNVFPTASSASGAAGAAASAASLGAGLNTSSSTYGESGTATINPGAAGKIAKLFSSVVTVNYSYGTMAAICASAAGSVGLATHIKVAMNNGTLTGNFQLYGVQ